jgi:hypothetical protein
MEDYKKIGIVYYIISKDINVQKVYIGSTSNLKERVRCHKKNCNNPTLKEYNYKVYRYIRSNGEWDNFYVFELEEVYYDTNYELRDRERYWIEYFKDNLNICIPNRTRKEYDKEYRLQNKEKIKDYYKQYRLQNKDYYKQYRLQNKDKIKEQKKDYHLQNKDKRKEEYKITIECTCGKIIKKRNKARHYKSNYHIKFS